MIYGGLEAVISNLKEGGLNIMDLGITVLDVTTALTATFAGLGGLVALFVGVRKGIQIIKSLGVRG